MKRYSKSLLSLLLAVLLVLSVAGLAEEIDGIDIPAVIEGDLIPADIPDDLPEMLDAIELPVPGEAPVADEPAKPAADTAEQAAEAVGNAIPSSITIGVKETYAIDISALSGKVTYASSKKSVAAVSKKGVITGKKAGKAKITVTPKSGKKKTITVTVKKAPSKVMLNKTKATLEVGKTLKLKATLPSNSASNQLTWTSSNKKVARVSSSGKVTALKGGTAKITVKTFNGKKATCKVTVEEPKPAGYTGDIWDYIGEDVDLFSNYIDDPLVLYSYEVDYRCYITGYMMVTASYTDNSILSIMLTSGDKSGKYTIDGIRPGYNLTTARLQAESRDWTYWYTSNNRYYYRAMYYGETIYLVIAAEGSSGSSNVNYVTILRQE